MSYEEDRHLDKVAQSQRFAESLKQGVFIDEHGPNPHVGGARCIHGQLVCACEKCRKEKP